MTNSGIKQPLVAIIVLNYNGWKDTLECLESIYRLHYDNYRVIVVDNASADDSVAKITAWAGGEQEVIYPESTELKNFTQPFIDKPIEVTLLKSGNLENSEYTRERSQSSENATRNHLTIIESSENSGYAGGNNLGLKYALKDEDVKYFWLVNNDTVVTLEALAKLVERMEEAPSNGMGGATFFYYYHPDKIQALGGASYNRWLAVSRHIGLLEKITNKIDTKQIESRLSYVNGAAMLVSRAFINDVGLMNEDYFLYFEELDWITRARGKFNLVYAPESIVYHKEGGTLNPEEGTNRKSRLADFYWHRNRIVFTRRYYPQRLPLVYLSFIGVLAKRIMRGQWDRFVMIVKILVASLFGRDISYPFR